MKDLPGSAPCVGPGFFLFGLNVPLTSWNRVQLLPFLSRGYFSTSPPTVEESPCTVWSIGSGTEVPLQLSP